MNNRILLTAAVVTVAALGAALTLGIERIHAQNIPLDECSSVGTGAPTSRLCLHQFTDHTKCVVAVTRGTDPAGTTTTDLSCKIT
jgi:hypothetical protein